MIGLAAFFLGALSLRAETEVIFSRVGPDAVEIETSGEKRVFSPSRPAVVEISRQRPNAEGEDKPSREVVSEEKEALSKKKKKRDPSIEMEPALSEGKVQGKVTSPSSKIMGNVQVAEDLPYDSSEGKILETAPLLNEDQIRYNLMEPAPAPSKKASSKSVKQAPTVSAANAEEMEALRAELASTQRRLAQMQRLMEQPLILKFKNDILDFQWAEAKQRITLPDDGIVRLQLAPKD